jgi:hypothetical protein
MIVPTILAMALFSVVGRSPASLLLCAGGTWPVILISGDIGRATNSITKSLAQTLSLSIPLWTNYTGLKGAQAGGRGASLD